MATSAKHSGWKKNLTTGAISAYVNGSEVLILDNDDHIKVNVPAAQVSKTIRLNSQTYTADGSIIGVQVKPRAGANLTNDITGLEIMPGIGTTAITSTKSIIGVNSNPYLHATAGAITGDIRAFQATLEKPTGAGTVTGTASILKCYNNTNGTITGGVFVLDIASHGDTQAWTGFLKAAASGAGGVVVGNMTAKSPENDAEAGYISIYVGTTRYEIPFYAVA
jgi:hypothetical protein